jgi:hypothetical protein
VWLPGWFLRMFNIQEKVEVILLDKDEVRLLFNFDPDVCEFLK